MFSKQKLAIFLTTATLVFVVCPALSLAETARPQQNEIAQQTRGTAWLFQEAWRTFRYDLEASLPGEHGAVLLIRRLRNEPPWLLRDAIRLSTNAEVQSILVGHVAKTRDLKCVPALRGALSTASNDRSRSVLESALIGLGDEHTLTSVKLGFTKGSYRERLDAAVILGSTGKRGERILVKAMTGADPLAKLAAATALAAKGHKGAKRTLLETLTSNNAFHKTEAAHALAAANDSRAIPHLILLLKAPGADPARVIRSLGSAGSAGERAILLEYLAKLPWGPRRPLRRETLIALGAITVRSDLSQLQSHLKGLVNAGNAGDATRLVWLETIGIASSQRIKSRARLLETIRKTIERPVESESAQAFRLRREQVGSLLKALAGSEPQVPHPKLYSADTSILTKWLRAHKSDTPVARQKRFDAAVALLADLGEELGHESLADPPEASALGLGGHRAIDGNYLTSWSVGSMTGPLRLELSRSTSITSLLVINGCVDSNRSYNDHSRVKKLKITLESGKQIEGTLADQRPYFQRIQLPSEMSREITLEVTETYPGKSKGSPACIPELRLL